MGGGPAEQGPPGPLAPAPALRRPCQSNQLSNTGSLVRPVVYGVEKRSAEAQGL